MGAFLLWAQLWIAAPVPLSFLFPFCSHRQCPSARRFYWSRRL